MAASQDTGVYFTSRLTGVHSRIVTQAIKMYEAKTFTLREITQATGLSKQTLYRYLNKGVG